MRTAEARRPSSPADTRERPAVVTEEAVRSYLADLSARGRSDATVQMYAARLRTFRGDLPPDGTVTRDTLPAWRDSLLARGYSPGTVNTHLSAANGLLEHMDRRDLQLVGRLTAARPVQPELTRTEYLRLLQAARTLGRERVYLIVKVFALIGPRVSELSAVTAEAVAAGEVPVTDDGERRIVPIPGCLRRELTDYLLRQGIRSGPVFLSRNGHPLRRTQVTAEVQSLAWDARVDESKCNPRCLRKLWQAAREDVERSVRLLAEQAYERVLDAEQLAAGWMEEASFAGREHRAESFRGHREEAAEAG